MPSVCLIPFDLKKTGDSEGLGWRTYFCPSAAKQKQETLANFSAVGEEDLGTHACRVYRRAPI
jgi:hypothetical protein